MEKENESIFEEDVDQETEVITEYDITTSPRDLTPASIVDMIDSGIIEIPFFQRNYVWDIKKASKLVESLILGLPVPELFFYSEGDENTTYKVIDGQQRLLSIYFFVKGRFPKNITLRSGLRNFVNGGYFSDKLMHDNDYFQDFTLQLNMEKGEEVSKYHGKRFTTLDKDTQIKFKLRRYLRTVVVRQNKPDDNNSSMFEIFNRLNTGGIPLNHQEIRASLYYCPFYQMLTELNGEFKWRMLLSSPTQDLHCNDVELILRAFAFLENGDSYTPKMVTFLNKYSAESKNFGKDKILYLRNLFISFIDACSSLDEKAFYRRNKFSKTLFESVFIAVCKKPYSKGLLVTGKIDKTSFNELKNDPDFLAYLASSSSSTDKINGRLNKAQEVIKVMGADTND